MTDLVQIRIVYTRPTPGELAALQAICRTRNVEPLLGFSPGWLCIPVVVEDRFDQTATVLIEQSVDCRNSPEWPLCEWLPILHVACRKKPPGL